MTSIPRCGACGAPLEREAAEVRCGYCGCTNRRMDPTVQAWTVRAAEARALAAALPARLAPVEAALEALMGRAARGEPVLEELVRTQERVLRLSYVPTMHLLLAQSPEDPARVRMVGEIETAIAGVLASVRGAYGAFIEG